MNLKLSQTNVKPGENVSLSIGSTLSSTVSLLAIDQRVLLLKSGNDLSRSDIFNDFDIYNNVQNIGFGFDSFRPFFWYETYEMKFAAVNLLILTNAIDIRPCEILTLLNFKNILGKSFIF